MHLSKYINKILIVYKASKILAFTKELNNMGDMGLTEKTWDIFIIDWTLLFVLFSADRSSISLWPTLACSLGSSFPFICLHLEEWFFFVEFLWLSFNVCKNTLVNYFANPMELASLTHSGLFPCSWASWWCLWWRGWATGCCTTEICTISFHVMVIPYFIYQSCTDGTLQPFLIFHYS